MNNIAEGFARYHKKEFIRFLDFSQSSAAELKSMTYVFLDLDYITDTESDQLHSQINKTKHLTLALIKYLNKNIKH